MSIQVARPKEYSPELESKIAYCNSLCTNAKDAVMSVYSQALNDGFTAQDAKRICLKEIRFFGRSQIYLYLPQESKDSKKAVKKPRRLSPPPGNQNGFEIRRLRHFYESQIKARDEEIAALKLEIKMLKGLPQCPT